MDLSSRSHALQVACSISALSRATGTRNEIVRILETTDLRVAECRRADTLVAIAKDIDGAFGQPQEAHFATDIARDALSRRFGATRPSIEPVRGLGGQLLYRARLAGLDQPQAASACALLRGQGLPCLTVSPGA